MENVLTASELRKTLKQYQLLWSAIRCVWIQLQSGAKTSGRGTPVLSIWPAELKTSWKSKPWIWDTSHPDGDNEIDKKTGETVIPPQLTLVYVRIPRRRIVIQLAWEQSKTVRYGGYSKQRRFA